MKANSEKTKQSNKATRRVLAGVLCGASVLSLVLSLVMPPISQAIANDAQPVSTEETVMGEGSSSESTGVGNTANGDTENQNSDDAEHSEGEGLDAADPSADGARSENDEQPADDGANDENEVMPTAADGFTEITDAAQLTQLQNGGSYRLAEDMTYDGQIDINGKAAVLDLYGHKIRHSGESNNYPLFNVHDGANFTIEDTRQAAETTEPQTDASAGNVAQITYAEGMPTSLTYFVTESTPKGTSTTEVLRKRTVAIGGAIVGTKQDSSMRLINVYSNGTFNLESGVLTQKEKCNVGALIYAVSGSTVNISGGYVCGASMGRNGAGAGIHVEGSTLEISGGVIAGNFAPSGGGVYAKDSAVDMVGGIISGNGTNNYESGYGAGICAENSRVTITNGYITNNNYQFYKDWEGSTKHLGFGCHGGGGIAAFNGGNLTIVGGYITGNYSAEAGGGVYAGAWNRALSGFTFSGGIIASNVAQNSEGGGIRIASPTVGEFNVSGKKAYITNNTTNTTNDWGGGGVFVQGGADGVRAANLKIYNALITNNSAQGYGGGFAACPTGKTAITDTNGIAIFGNRDENGAHLSGGTNGKNEDQPTTVEGGEITDTFKQNGHKDLFLIRKSDNSDYIAAVTGQMLGGGAANWKGTIDGQPPTTIGKYEGAQAKYMIGLDADPSDGDQGLARDNATLFITGNKSNIHGGGIMTNGDVVAGSTTQVSVYPKMKLNGTKALVGRDLGDEKFTFQLLKQNEIKNESGQVTGYTAPSFDANGKLLLNGCSVVGTAENAKDGSFSFNLSEVYADPGLVYYLVEVPGADKDVNYDKTIYKIDPNVVEDKNKSHSVLGIEYVYYTVESVTLTKIAADGSKTDTQVKPKNEDGIACVALTNGATFTNYTSNGSWTPKATKVVEGGEMKEFTLEFADNPDFADAQTVKTTAGRNNSQTLEFSKIEYKLGSLKQNDAEAPGRGASKTFTYYVREKNESSTYPHYKFDLSVYEIKVVATDNAKGEIDCEVTYRQIQDCDGKPVNNDTDTPTFTNTYSTSLPLSGMSGVTLTYLAGAAVLCAAAAWMHIRRKANAKGGERRE